MFGASVKRDVEWYAVDASQSTGSSSLEFDSECGDRLAEEGDDNVSVQSGSKYDNESQHSESNSPYENGHGGLRKWAQSDYVINHFAFLRFFHQLNPLD